jgi:hypothetical protein
MHDIFTNIAIKQFVSEINKYRAKTAVIWKKLALFAMFSRPFKKLGEDRRRTRKLPRESI